MLDQILEFLLYSGWQTLEGHHLSLSKVYNSETHTTDSIWGLGKDKFTLDEVVEINLNFELRKFVLWTTKE